MEAYGTPYPTTHSKQYSLHKIARSERIGFMTKSSIDLLQ